MTLRRLTSRVVVSYASIVVAVAAALGVALGLSEATLVVALAIAGAVAAAGVALAAWIGARLTRSTAVGLAAVADALERLGGGDFADDVLGEVTEDLVSLRDAYQRAAEALDASRQALIAEREQTAAERDRVMADRDRVTAERDEVAATLDHIATALDEVADGVLHIDGAGRTLLANGTARRLMGLEPDAAIGASLREGALRRLVVACRETGERQEDDVEFAATDRSARAVATPLAAGEASGGVLVTLQDLTHLQRVERNRGEFISNVVHALRTPLTSLTAMVEALEDGLIPSKTGDAAGQTRGRIQRDLERMTALVEQLLLLSVLESGQAPLIKEPVDIELVLAEVREGVRSRANALRLVVAVEPDESAQPAMAAPDKVRQVIEILVDNALRLTPSGGRLVLRTWTTGDRVHVSAEDTGPGVEPEHLPHLFERFYTVNPGSGTEAAGRSAAGGTGLGLAIARRIVEAHDGHISVRSRVGEGTTFEFTLPVA